MAKESWKPGTMINPLPAVLVTCGSKPSEWNMITIAWTGTICTNPPMCYISVRPERASYPLLIANMEFTINLTTVAMARATDWAGVRSGRDYDKWAETGLTPLPGEKVASPTIEQSPLSIECRIKEVMHLGSHDMFIADVVNVRADTEYIDPETGAFSLEKADLLAYSHGFYHSLGPVIGRFGFSVKK
ncbi:MAG: flavin reductase family protein [Muribaculaceae bacterium]|nr:flavin reductase family protein [Bacteroides sp.]MDE6681601.1 flavin reductase family protein [Muribaculaceae bacterium]MDE6843442.1 flavin reductase family protein [Muribaculaceae bacterium]MDE7190369.1 flavin reductase family protein [Muribaculaceae bacterium]